MITTRKLEIELVDSGFTGTQSGIGRYTTELYNHLSRQATINLRKNCYFPFANHFPWLTALPLGIRDHKKGQLVHFTHSIGCAQLLWHPIHPSVVTVHDLGFVSWPPEKEMFIHKWMDILLVKLSHLGLKKADSIITVSDFTRQELVSKLNVLPDHVETVHLGTNLQRFKPIKDARRLISQRYPFLDDIQVKYILNVGAESPRKNLGTLLKAISLLPPQVKLIKIGSPGGERFRANTLKLIRDYDLQQRVILIDRIPEEELPLFYNLAAIYICPSFLEGFGFPVLEAMACGTPVICANTSSLPEITGAAGILVQPEDAQAFAQASNEILESPEIRSEASERVQDQAKKFSWEKTIQHMIKIYERFA